MNDFGEEEWNLKRILEEHEGHNPLLQWALNSALEVLRSFRQRQDSTWVVGGKLIHGNTTLHLQIHDLVQNQQGSIPISDQAWSHQVAMASGDQALIRQGTKVRREPVRILLESKYAIRTMGIWVVLNLVVSYRRGPHLRKELPA